MLIRGVATSIVDCNNNLNIMFININLLKFSNNCQRILLITKLYLSI